MLNFIRESARTIRVRVSGSGVGRSVDFTRESRLRIIVYCWIRIAVCWRQKI